MAGLSLSEYTNLLRTIYANPEKILYRDRPLFGMMPKRDDMRGLGVRIPMVFGTGSGRSKTFSNAQTDTSEHKNDAALVTHVSDYGLAQIDGDVIDMAKDAGGELAPIQVEVEAKMNALSDAIAHGVYRDVNAVAGQDNGSWSTPDAYLVLSDVADAQIFQAGQIVKSAATAGGTLRAGTVTVSKVNRVTGRIDFTGAIDAGIAAFAASDYLFVEGDQGLGISGLSDWIPVTPGTLFGLDQTVGNEVGGTRVAYSTDIETTISNMLGTAASLSTSIDHIFLHPTKYATLMTQLDGKNTYERASFGAQGKDGKNFANIGYAGIAAHFKGFRCNVIPDPFAPVGGSSLGGLWGLRLEDYVLHTNGTAPRFFDYGHSDQFVTVYNADGVEVRQGYRLNAAYHRPISGVIGDTA